ncbi:hypothetical protein J6590_027911 [Homalodisca vitripennis]|nr:hypothetical protein J6590_027911 [Homalodisca vitripennis]
MSTSLTVSETARSSFRKPCQRTSTKLQTPGCNKWTGRSNKERRHSSPARAIECRPRNNRRFALAHLARVPLKAICKLRFENAICECILFREARFVYKSLGYARLPQGDLKCGINTAASLYKLFQLGSELRNICSPVEQGKARAYSTRVAVQPKKY